MYCVKLGFLLISGIKHVKFVSGKKHKKLDMLITLDFGFKCEFYEQLLRRFKNELNIYKHPHLSTNKF